MEQLDSVAIRYEIAAELVAREGVNQDDVCARLDLLARELNLHRPAEQALVGLDRPITLHVAPPFSAGDAGLAQLLEVIRARPWERHLVLLTGQGKTVPELQARIAEVGGAALAADPVLGSWDCWLWLMAKLDAIAAQRLMIHLRRSDLAARLAARLVLPRYQRRLYILHSASNPVDPIPGATHLVHDLAARRAIRAQRPELHIGVLPQVERFECRFAKVPDLPAPPPTPGPGRRAALRWRKARAQWRVKWIGTRVYRRTARSTLMKAFCSGREGVLRRLRPTEASANPARFFRRLEAIIALTEGRIALLPVSSERRAHAEHLTVLMQSQPGGNLFEAPHYLGQLPAFARAVASRDPFTHYLVVGEALGFHPHSLFDPRMAERSMASTAGVAEAAGQHPASLTLSVLGRYLVAGGTAKPHQFFDPPHYLRQVPVPPATPAVLLAYLHEGEARGLSPHPLIEPTFLTGGKSSEFPGVFRAWLRGEVGSQRSTYPLFDAGSFLEQDGNNRLRNAAPNLLWAYLVEGNLGERHPHLLIWPEQVEKNRPGTLISAQSVLELIAQNRLGKADPHPLVSTAHILSQASWLAQSTRHPLRHYLESGVAENIDPHPWFSTQFYLYRSPDVVRAGVNPLLHYLRNGAKEGRSPAGFFSGVSYFQRFLLPHVQMGEKHHPELLDYVLRGAGLFWATVDYDDALRRMRFDTVTAQFVRNPEDPSGSTVKLLREAVHPPVGALHPDLCTEIREFRTNTPTDEEDACDIVEFAPGQTVSVSRAPVACARHIATLSGSYDVPAVEAALFSKVTVVGGNDGFITASGVWQDYGLGSFDSTSMEPKGNAAVVAVSGAQVLLRRYKTTHAIAAGIFACGSYSKNYYHFLIETLPRVICAARVAPPGTPILTDDDMPAQHYQALRLILPDNPIVRLARHRSYSVERLWAGSMPNSFADAFLKPEVPADAVRVHPAILRLYGDLARRLWPVEADRDHLPKRLFLRRVSRWRQLLNADALIAEMKPRDFSVIDAGKLSFADQIRAFANAEAVVGQSGAHFANMVFARPGASIYPLFSNAPGSNYNLWPVLGAPLGLKTVNVVGWRVPGSTGGAAPEAHEHFTVPPHLLTAFFPNSDCGSGFKDILDALLQAGTDAEALTSAWAITAEATPAGFDDRLRQLRRAALHAIETATDAELPKLLAHSFFSDPWTTLKSGLRGMGDHDAAETAAIERAQQHFVRLSDVAAAPVPPAEALRLMLTAMLLLPAWKAELIARPEALSASLLSHYLRWITQSPYLFREGEDEGYVDYCARLLDWISEQLEADRPVAIRDAVAKMAASLDMGQLFLIEAPLGRVFAARNRVLERIAVSQGQARPKPRAADGSEGRRRVGVLFRTFDKGPDSEAVVSMFRAFPREQYEIFGYSFGFQDRVVSADSAFDRELDAAIEHRRLLPANPTEMRTQILADDLDVFVFANATTYGLQAQDMALYHRVAPVQMIANSHVPQPLGFPSFDYYLTGSSDHPDHEVDQSDYSERFMHREGPVICYLHSLRPRAHPPLNRSTLGLGPDDVVMFNAGSMQKLRRECLLTMMRAVKDVPGGVLMLAPYNPGWAGRAQAFPFNRQLAEATAEAGLDPARIKVLSELTVAEAEAALACSDIYLTPFPHGGATMAHLALIYGVPPVVLRRRSTRSIDQFLIGSLGLDSLLADTPEDYIRIAHHLGTDEQARTALTERLAEAVKTPAFVDNLDYSRDIEAALDALLNAAEPR